MEGRSEHQEPDDEDVLPCLHTVTEFDDGVDEIADHYEAEYRCCFEEVGDISPTVTKSIIIKPEVTRLARDEDTSIVLEETFSSPKSFLIESLVKQLCKFMEKDSIKQRNLYSAVCRILYNMKLIDGTYGIEELEFIRSHYLQAMLHLLQTASIASETEPNKELVRLDRNNIKLFKKLPCPKQLFDWSRYQTEYVELEYIAHGGFGHVYKARNKLDGCLYAIKKIYLRYHNVDTFLKNLQEVKMLAQLHHPNIVAYKAAWLEPFQGVTKSKYQNLLTDDSLSLSLPNDSERVAAARTTSSEQKSSDILFKNVISGSTSQSSISNSNSENEEITSTNVCDRQSRSDNKLIQESHSAVHQSSSVSSCTESSENAVCKFAQLEKKAGGKLKHLLPLERHCAMLYIQMQLCDCTLREWLNERNSNRIPLNIEQCTLAFHHLVRGIEYIHSKGIVHHDIKPSNIFVNHDLTQVQVGDFGLACFLQHSHQEVTLLPQPSLQGDHRNMEIGTKLYAAPEQLKGICDFKSDIYSLGIVLFELLQPCYTDMEKNGLITQLKAGTVSEKLCALAPKLVEMMICLTSWSVDKRPTSKQLLTDLENLSCHSINDSTSASETIKRLLSEINKRDKEIEELKQSRCQCEKEIEELTCRLQKYEP